MQAKYLAVSSILILYTMKAKLIAYFSQCIPILEYARALWDPTNKIGYKKIEHVQNQTIRFIANLKGRSGINDIPTELQLKVLGHRLTLLMRILLDEECHETLSSAHDELLNSNWSRNTLFAKRGEPTSISLSLQTFHNSFLLRSIRDLRIPPHNTNLA